MVGREFSREARTWEHVGDDGLNGSEWSRWSYTGNTKRRQAEQQRQEGNVAW
jgi:hypothetical protein